MSAPTAGLLSKIPERSTGMPVELRFNQFQPGNGLERAAIAAPVINAISLMDGRGSVLGAFVGVLFFSNFQKGLAQIAFSKPSKQLIAWHGNSINYVRVRIRSRNP